MDPQKLAEMKEVQVETLMHDEGFQITDDSLANWAIKKVRAERLNSERQIKVLEEEKKALEYLIKREKEKALEKESFLVGCLRDYYESVDADFIKQTKTESQYVLPAGKLVVKKAKDQLVYDKNVLIKESKHNEFLTKYVKQEVMESFDWAGFKKTLEIVDGVIVSNETGCILSDIESLDVKHLPEEFIIK